MASVRFYLEKRKDKITGVVRTKNLPILLFFSFDGKRLQYYTGERIDEKNWNSGVITDKKGRKKRIHFGKVKSNYPGSLQINAYLQSLAEEVQKIHREAKIMGINPTIQYIRDNMIKNKKSSGTSFFNNFDEFIRIESKKNDWVKSTSKMFKTLQNHLKQFSVLKKYKLEYDSINDSFFEKYTDYLKDDRDYLNTTIAKHIKLIKWFLNWSTRKGYNKNLVYKDYKLKGKKNKNSELNKIVLNWEELLHLYDLEISEVHIEQIRDVFCFMCFTGLRYSDAHNLKKNDIHDGNIIITIIKTDETLSIPLNEFSQEILEKYKDYPINKALPVISSQKMNKHLKKLGELAGFDEIINIVHYQGNKRIEKTYKKYEVLKTSVGRKTFITNALWLNIPAEVIMEMTGHKTHKIMEGYLKIVDEHKKREMTKFNRNSYMKKVM